MEKKKSIAIGISDFKRLIEEDYYFIDKSLLIKELLDHRAAVTLVPRPRRFGKTLNLSLLRYFFEKVADSNRHLFKGLAIENYAECMVYQGEYPVIWITFKDIKTSSWDLCYRGIQEVLASEFSRHQYLLTSDALSDQQKRNFTAILNTTADEMVYRRALLNLSEYLAAHYQKRAIILIDEYDTPIHAAFLMGHYDRAIEFFRDFLGAGLKDNVSLEFCFITGILRVAKESIFSGLNNLEVHTFTQAGYSDKFGFLEEEVVEMMNHLELSSPINEMRKWYDGYQSGSHKVYNPWSIISIVKNQGILQPYWVNTSDNALVKTLLQQSSPVIKEDFELIVQGKAITKVINENVIMPEIYQDDNALWNFLFMSGYLTFENYRADPRLEGQFLAELKTPNTEVAFIYTTQIQSWFGGTEDSLRIYQRMLHNLVAGKTDEFCELFELFSSETISSFDVGGKKPERFYHALVLGMLASLRSTHEIRSNRESGWGRYDVMVIPHDKSLPGIIIEFKTVSTAKKETLETAAHNALQQIEDRQYEVELRSCGIGSIIKLGIAFEGKRSLVLVG